MDEAKLKNAKFYALKIINFRPRSNEELIKKLEERGYSDEIITTVISEFEKKGLLNDKKFSKLWVDSRMHSRPKGELALRRELKEKGVSEKTIDEVIEKTKKEYNEYEVVKNLAEARMAALEGLDKTTAKRRLFGYLKRRGFNFEIIMKVVGEKFEDR